MNIQIAQSCKIEPIVEIANKLGISEDELDLYGNKAKLSNELWKRLKIKRWKVSIGNCCKSYSSG